ncbi:MAG: hypothetical protein DMD41_01635 [Gemmatimonadetes bacterium]|nr:MAG: hypothetical protein DMD41_01635 [Gemmatimonadota bacterium]
MEALDDVTDGDGDDGEVAGEGFLDGIRGAFLPRGEDQGVARAHVIGHLGVRDAPSEDEPHGECPAQDLDRLLGQREALAR